MDIKIVGASQFIGRDFEACGNFQWVREHTQNSIEAHATKIEFGIEWQAVKKFGVYRRTIIDNGDGMTRKEAIDLMSVIGLSSKPIDGVHNNYGIGARIATLPWNSNGIVLITKKQGEVSMICMKYRKEDQTYYLEDFIGPNGLTSVMDPTIQEETDDDINWGTILPDWVEDHGTAIVLLGDNKHPDTILGVPNTEERHYNGISIYLNSRYWDLRHMEMVRVINVQSDDQSKWPKSIHGEHIHTRLIQGALRHIVDVTTPGETGRLADQGFLSLANGRVRAEYYLWEGDRPGIHGQAQKQGYIAVRYKGELYGLTNNKTKYRPFGVIETEVQRNLTIILEPQLYDNTAREPWGIYPDQSRTRLMFTGEGKKGADLPISEWATEFANNQPASIKQAIMKSRGNVDTTTLDDSYRKRLQDQFGDRWRTIRPFLAILAETRARELDEEATAFVLPPNGVDGTDPLSNHKGDKAKKKGHRAIKEKKKRVELTPDGAVAGIDHETPVDIPRYRLETNPKNFEKPWHLALWAPNDPDGPTVYINVNSPFIQKCVEDHQDMYPEIYADEIAQEIRQAYGEIAVTKVAHAQFFKAFISEQNIDTSYRTEEALTIALMGFMAEEAVIVPRLKRFGKRDQ